MEMIPCPFVYTDGRRCEGEIVRIEAYKADLVWERNEVENWSFSWSEPRSHFHLFCSLKDNHSGHGRGDDDLMKFYLNQLPEAAQEIVFKVQ